MGVLALPTPRCASPRPPPDSAAAGQRGRDAGGCSRSGLPLRGLPPLLPTWCGRSCPCCSAGAKRGRPRRVSPFSSAPPGSWEVFDLLLQALNQEELRGGAFPCSPLHLYWPLGAFQRVSHRKTASYIIN